MKIKLITCILTIFMLVFGIAACGNMSGENSTTESVTPPSETSDSSSDNSSENHSESQSNEEHVHEYAKEVVAPTCTERGYTVYICSCGDSYTSDYTEETGHNWGEWVVLKTPECEKKGEEVRTCLNDNKHVEKREISALEHDYVAKVTAASCTTGGYTTYTCSRCGDTYESDFTSALNHKWGEWVVVKAATADENGEERRACQNDSTHVQTRAIPALGHNYVGVVTKPTCTESGYTTYTCTDCGNSFVSDYVDALGHDWGEWKTVKPATCTESGTEQRVCSHDSTHVETREVKALGHDYVGVETKPTCTESGYTTYTCLHCNYTYYDDYVDALNHDIITVNAKAPTCKEIGWEQYEYCTRCDYTTYVELAKTNHEYILDEFSSILEPEEGENVELVFICKYCGEATYGEEIETQEGFSIEEVVATCANDGYKKLCYTADGEKREIILETHSADIHSHWKNEQILPDSTVYRMSELAAIFGEKYGELTYFNPANINCYKEGNASFVCDKCNETILIKVLADHEYDYDLESSTFTEEKVVIVYRCTVCKDATYEQEIKTYEYEIIDEPATCAKAGRKHIKYSYELNGEVKNEEKTLTEYPINANNHEYNEKPIETSKTYRFSELKVIFGYKYDTEVQVFSASTITCTKEGYASFVCDKCGQTILIKVLADHVWEVEVEPGVDEETGLIAINYKCENCDVTDVLKILAKEYTIVDVPATCAKDGNKTLYYTYFDAYGVEQNGSIVLETYAKSVTVHYYNDTVIDTTKKLTFSEIDAIFGAEVEGEYRDITIFNKKKITCAKAGLGEFICTKCGTDVFVNVLDDHKMAVVGEPVVDHEAGLIAINYKCENCDVTDVLKISANEYTIEEKQADCEETGYKKIVYSYMLNGEFKEVEIIIAEYPIDGDVHKYGGYIIDLEHAYTMAELKEIFGEKLEGLTFFANDNTHASFVCDGCKNTVKINIAAN
ncbi:MAG: hypothetical protein J6N93_01500 [Clostridia bacterium]|nr:hypothetical protein [Clostridia bacterium]